MNAKSNKMKETLTTAIHDLAALNTVIDQNDSGLLAHGQARYTMLENLAKVAAALTAGINEYTVSTLQTVLPGSKLEFYSVGFDPDLKCIVVRHSSDYEDLSIKTAPAYLNLCYGEVAEKLKQFSLEFSQYEFSNYAKTFMEASLTKLTPKDFSSSAGLRNNTHLLLKAGRIVAYLNSALTNEDDVEGLLSLGYQILPIETI